MNFTRILVLFSLLLPFMACADQRSVDCGAYSKMIHDSDRREELLKWADDQVFSRNFEKKDFDEITGFVGPGRTGANFSIEKSGIEVPRWLDGYTIRAVGPDKFHPDVLLVGLRRYQGILIARKDLDESVSRTTMDKSKIEGREGRLAMICYL